MSDMRKRLFQGLVEYWINVFYLALVFATFMEYRRLVLAAHDITYTNYGVAVMRALILAKVVMIGDMLRLGREFDKKPLIYSTLLRTVVFCLFVGAFAVIEHEIKSLWNGKGLAEGFVEFLGKEHHEMLAGCMVTFVAFIPFFAFRDLERVLGRGKIGALFFQSRVEVNGASDPIVNTRTARVPGSR